MMESSRPGATLQACHLKHQPVYSSMGTSLDYFTTPTFRLQGQKQAQAFIHGRIPKLVSILGAVAGGICLPAPLQLRTPRGFQNRPDPEWPPRQDVALRVPQVFSPDLKLQTDIPT